jgi:lipoprotein-releasing system permease protein
MSLSFFIARRLYREDRGGKQVSRPAVLIALTGIAVGLAVMILSVAVVTGFKKEVRAKVVGFGAHIQITNAHASRSYETPPIVVSDSLLQMLTVTTEVKHWERYSTKPGMIKTADDFQGMVLKGVGAEFDPSFFREHLEEGVLPQFGDSAAATQVVISRTLADKLRLHVGDKIDTYYIQEQVRARRLTIVGIYRTDFSEYDNLFLLTDIRLVNRLNNWNAEQASGVELTVKDYSRLEEVTWQLADRLYDHTDAAGAQLVVQNIEQLMPQIFSWLGILDMNIWVILILMTGVAGFTMVSGLLIIIIERTTMIGLLKSLGAGNTLIRRVFLWLSVFLIGKGMLWGNVIGLLIYFVQRWLHLIPLNADMYYMDTVPMSLSLWVFLLLNIGTLFVSVLMLLAPSYLITRISPAQSMRYE